MTDPSFDIKMLNLESNFDALVENALGAYVYILVEPSENKKRDSVAMIDSDAISICRLDCEDMTNEDTVIGVINSISQQNSNELLIVEFTIGGVIFNCKIDRKIMQEQRFLPSDRVFVNIDTSMVCWI